MKISELFRRLSINELSNLAMSGDGNGTIASNKQGVIILHTNTAMNRLYSRFALRLRETDVETVEGQRVYEVAPDLIKILTVSDSDGVEFPLNVRGDRWAMQSTSDNELKVPADLRAQTLTVEYQAGPDPLSLEDFDLDFEIELPEVLHPALTTYIAAEVYGYERQRACCSQCFSPGQVRRHLHGGRAARHAHHREDWQVFQV